ncbi:guanine nucleotide exchange factor DBS-like isoform X2 [Neocloeon triangulifer]|uniref:guanine nucleotide exchange factor DBS-like isoform X2 n=1 Tax=Neocloeon triangulifer TaxID=2078957 RepID=UPI00286ED772|nr:guanine nucleotide exchange factor DBS-like isoform X2 [Neocloeon triangulifer]
MSDSTTRPSSPRGSPGTLETQLDSLLETFKRSATRAMMESPVSSSSSPSQDQGSDTDIPGRLLRFRLPSARRLPFNLSLKRSRSGVSALSSEQDSPPSDNTSSPSSTAPRCPLASSRSAAHAPHRRSLPGLLEASGAASCASSPVHHSSKCCISTADLTANPPDDGMVDVDYELTLCDVADVLRGRYAIITGGKSRDGRPLITFPDLGNFSLLEDEDYQRLMVYLTSVPSMQEADVGFVLVIDRRNDKWNSIKTVLLKISGFFPGLIHVAYVLRPAGFLQKAISEVSNKLFKDEFKFQMQICNSVEELHEYVDVNQLTPDLSGTLPYSHEEWLQQRFALEKFSNVTHQVSKQLHDFTQRLQDAGFPNDVASTTKMMIEQEDEYSELKEHILNAAKHGENLLAEIRQSPQTLSIIADSHQSDAYQTFPDRISNVSAVERLLVQLEETERTFDDFWQSHYIKMSQCLELRQFEQNFRELQTKFDDHLSVISHMTEIGESVNRVDYLINEANVFERKCLFDLERAEELQGIGTELMSSRHYGMDSIRPKCVELCRMAQNLGERLQHRTALLAKCRELQERIERANKWCAEGIEMLAQPMEKNSTPEQAEQALTDLEAFKAAGAEWGAVKSIDLKQTFKDVITPETKALVQQVVTRVEDVLMMCDRRQETLKKLAVKPAPKPVQQVNPEPAMPLATSYSSGSSDDSNQPPSMTNFKRTRAIRESSTDVSGAVKGANSQRTGEWPDSSSPDSEASNHDHEALKTKRGHVLAELLDTERTYVSEMASILRGYRDELHVAEKEGRAPVQIYGKSDVLFGNLEDLHRFHRDVFLTDLENCITTPELVGLCFVQRRESFHRMYSTYCQNNPRSEALRQTAGEQQCAFFKECQQKLDHKLPLGAYLLKPVQRITKYQLLLKDLLRYSEDLPNSLKELQSALDCMLVVLKCVNDSMHQVAITGFWGNLMEQGELLMHGQFNVWIENKKDRLRELRLKPMQRQIFLYEKSILFCKRVGRDPETATYQFKTFLQMSQVGLTENVRGSKGDQRKLELWLQGRQEVYTVQAQTMQHKEAFLKAIKQVLLSQLEQLKGDAQKKLQRGMSQSALTSQRPLRQTSSWESQAGQTITCPTSNVTVVIPVHNNNGMKRRSSRHMSSDASGGSAAEREEDEAGWSSDYSNSDEEESNQDPFGAETSETSAKKFTALADYCAMGSSEVTMHEGDVIELLKVGCAGWWFVKVLGSQQEGWAPSAYLEVIGGKKMSRHSSPSVSSQDSGMGTNNGRGQP